MKIISKNIFQWSATLLMLLALVFTTACEEDEVGTSEVEVLSFGPAGVKHGEEIVFIGTNLDKINSIVFKPDVEVSKDGFTSHNAGQIKLNVPAAAEAGTITLNVSDGNTLETKTILNFEVPVVISGFTSETKPGTNLTITGDKLNWIETITFPADITLDKEDFVSQSLKELVVEVPMEAQSGFLIFSSGGTEPMTFGTESQLQVTLPAVTELGPASIRHTDDLTIKGTDLDLVTSVVLSEEVTVLKSEFKSQSASEIVLAVPANVVAGTLTLKQASPVDVVTSEELTIILPVGTSLSPSPAVPGEDDLTIVGTDLDLVASLEFPAGGIVDQFVSQSSTEIVVSVPEGSDNGAINYTTIHGFSGGLGVTLIVPGDGPPPLPLSIYDDAFFFNGQNWSWGGDTDFASGDQFYSGSLSAKITYTGTDGGLQIGNLSGVDASNLDAFAFSLFGGPGTSGKQVAIILSNTWGNYNTVTIEEGKWTQFKIDLSSYPDVNLTDVNNIIFKMEGTAGGEVMYVDRVGFDKSNDPVTDPDLVIFDFNGKNSWWGDVAIVEDAATSADGTAYGHINLVEAGGDWQSLFFRNGSDNFPTSLSGEDPGNFVFKFDIQVNKPIEQGEIKFRLKGDTGDFFYLYGPTSPAGETIAATSGWVTVTVEMSEFKDAFGTGTNSPTDIGDLGGEFGAAFTFQGGTTALDFYIDNVRFERK